MIDEMTEHRVETAAQVEAQAWLDQEHGDPDPDPAPETFAIRNIGAAEWAKRKVDQQEALLAAAVQEADKEIERWEAFKALKRQQCEGRTRFLAAHLEAYARAIHEATGQQTISLPSGRLSLRKQPAAIEWPNLGTPEEDALTKWAYAHNMATASTQATGPDAEHVQDLATQQGLTCRLHYSKTAIKASTQGTPDGALVDTTTGEIVPGARYAPGGDLVFSMK